MKNETPPARDILAGLVAEQGRLEAERQAMRDKQSGYEADLQRLLNVVEPDDGPGLKRIGELSTLVKLCPNALKRIDSQLAAMAGRMAPSIAAIHAEIQQRYLAVRDRILGQFQTALAGLVDPGEAPQAAWKSAVHSPTWKRLNKAFPEVGDRAGLAGQYRTSPAALLDAVRELDEIEAGSAQAE
jgi:hypothetical protein